MYTEPIEGVAIEACPFTHGHIGIACILVAGHHSTVATQGSVLAWHTVHERCITGVDANLTDRVDNRTTASDRDDVITRCSSDCHLSGHRAARVHPLNAAVAAPRYRQRRARWLARRPVSA